MRELRRRPLRSSHSKATEAPGSSGERTSQIDGYRTNQSQQNQELEETRAELRESFSRYNELYELSPVGFLSLNRKGCIVQLNDKAADLLGYSPAWLIGRPFMVFIAKADLRRFLGVLTHSLQDPDLQTIEIDLFLDGRIVPVQISLRTSASGENLIQRMTLLDLTEIKKVETRLHEALENWAALVESAPDVIMTVQRDGKITFVNRPVWGCSIPELVGTRITDYLSANDRPKIEQCMQRTFAFRQRTTCEITGVNGDTSWFSFSFGAAKTFTTTTTTTTTIMTSTVMIREISEQKHAEELLRSSGEQLREFAARVETVREEERRRLAREIHDELGQALTILKLDLSWVHSKTPGDRKEERKKLRAMMGHVDETIERVRGIASALRPAILDDLGLGPAIEWQLSEYQKRTGIQCQLESTVEKLDLTPEVSAAIFRVVQEALTNVIRHAKASNVCVELKSDGGILTISIIDDGKGVSEQEINDLRSLGIVGMKERISRLGGIFNISSGPSQGTRIDITIPTEND